MSSNRESILETRHSGVPETLSHSPNCRLRRCHDVDSDERKREKKEEKCPFLENSGSEEDVLQILQYMATILSE